MSTIGRKHYVNEAVVRPFLRYDSSTGQAIYGDPVTIECFFTTSTDVFKTEDGIEMVASMKFLTEYSKVKPLDLIGGKVVRFVGLINSSSIRQKVMDYKIYV